MIVPILAVDGVPVVVERDRVTINHGRVWFTVVACGVWVRWHRVPT